MKRKRKHRRAIIIPDQHFPLHDERAVNVVLKAIALVKPNIFINLGDVGEWESVSSWKYKKIKQPPLEYQLPWIRCIDREMVSGLLHHAPLRLGRPSRGLLLPYRVAGREKERVPLCRLQNSVHDFGQLTKVLLCR